MMTPFAVDTSVAIPLLVDRHDQHEVVRQWWAGRPLALAGHALAETYSVLTRLPSDLRLSPRDAVRLLEDRFEPAFLVSDTTMSALPRVLADAGVAGGATYDGLVALAAREHGATLATRDARAMTTYRDIGAAVEIVPAIA